VAGLATLTRQCLLFAIGSTFFAVATAPGFAAITGSGASNALCFVGSWFFTTAAWMQLALAESDRGIGWWSAASQFAGTILFNVSTGASVWAHTVHAERREVWAPDATGSLAFLVSGVLAVMVVGRWAPRSVDWQAGWINLIGCIAFGVSAAAAFVFKTGITVNAPLANLGTFVGALCFLAAALLLLPRR
jgi:energy-converting hydrogenase Eha subunit A